MALDPSLVRLEILKLVVPNASRHSIAEPEKMLEIARTLENYVLESPKPAEETPDSATGRRPGRPRKEKPEPPTPDFLTPPMVDKSNQTPG